MPARTKYDNSKQPSSIDISVWRYMDLAKFLALLVDKALYFSRADLLGDNFEGSVSLANHREYIKRYQANPERVAPPGTVNFSGIREFVYINCWHMNEFESAAMWSLYGGEKGAIAIRSTYAALAAALPDEAILGMVTYADYNSDLIPEKYISSLYMHKRFSFSHEHEVRAVISKIPKGRDKSSQPEIERPPGLKILVNVKKLIKGITSVRLRIKQIQLDMSGSKPGFVT
jgi:hypothetical protein